MVNKDLLKLIGKIALVVILFAIILISGIAAWTGTTSVFLIVVASLNAFLECTGLYFLSRKVLFKKKTV